MHYFVTLYYHYSLILFTCIPLLFIDCDDIYNRGILASGVQLIKPSPNKSSLSVYCVMQKPQEIEGDNSEDGIEAGRGWTVIQQRTTGIQIKKTLQTKKCLMALLCCFL